MSGPLERDAYVELPRWAEEDNVAWWILKPLYGLSTGWEGWRETMRHFLPSECGGSYFPR